MKYRTICVDPPWRYRKGAPIKQHGRRWAEDVYDTMSNAEILALPVRELAETDAHLYLWITNPRMYGERDDDSITPHDIIKAWGFSYKTCLTWVKSQPGLGSYFRGKTEHVLFAVRGNLPIAPERRQPNVIFAKRTEHSAKPEHFYDLVEQVSPGPYVELFARRHRLQWDVWGDESANTATLEAPA